MKKLTLLFLLIPFISFSQTYSTENECEFVLITKDTNLIKNIEKTPIASYSCFDTRIGQATMYWFNIEDKAYIRKRIKISTL
jgi:hypothetical protein